MGGWSWSTPTPRHSPSGGPEADTPWEQWAPCRPIRHWDQCGHGEHWFEGRHTRLAQLPLLALWWLSRRTFHSKTLSSHVSRPFPWGTWRSDSNLCKQIATQNPIETWAKPPWDMVLLGELCGGNPESVPPAALGLCLLK